MSKQTIPASHVSRTASASPARGDKGKRESLGVAVVLMQLKEPDGSPSWAYVALSENRMGEFLANAGKPIEPQAYGEVLLQGKGELPSAEAREYIFDTYGFDS